MRGGPAAAGAAARPRGGLALSYDSGAAKPLSRGPPPRLSVGLAKPADGAAAAPVAVLIALRAGY